MLRKRRITNRFDVCPDDHWLMNTFNYFINEERTYLTSKDDLIIWRYERLEFYSVDSRRRYFLNR